MEPLYVFLIVGQVQMASFKAAFTVMNAGQLYWPAWALTEPGRSVMWWLCVIPMLNFFLHLPMASFTYLGG
jgi:hypothetical protein